MMNEEQVAFFQNKLNKLEIAIDSINSSITPLLVEVYSEKYKDKVVLLYSGGSRYLVVNPVIKYNGDSIVVDSTENIILVNGIGNIRPIKLSMRINQQDIVDITEVDLETFENILDGIEEAYVLEDATRVAVDEVLKKAMISLYELEPEEEVEAEVTEEEAEKAWEASREQVKETQSEEEKVKDAKIESLQNQMLLIGRSIRALLDNN